MKKCKITPELIEQAKDNIRLGFSYSALSLSLGISEDTFYTWMRKGREGQQPYVSFLAAIKDSEAELLKECLNQLKTSMKLGNVESAKWILERRFSSDYGKKSDLNVKSENKTLNVNVNANLEHEDLEKIRMKILEKLAPRELPEGLK